MTLRNGVELRIFRELDYETLQIAAYRYGMFVGWLKGYKNHRNKTVKIFPYKKIVPGVFRKNDLPVQCRIDELPWEKKIAN